MQKVTTNIEGRPLLTITVEEFIEALRQGMGLSINNESEAYEATQPKKHYIYGMQALADLLGCSIATANRIKKSGAINAAIAQKGKVIVIDADMVLELLRVKNHKNYK